MKVAASPRIYMGAMPESGGGSDTRETHFQHTGEPTPSRYARQPLPEEGARMWGRFECINSSFLWKEVPAGRRLGDAERSEKGASQVDDLRKHPSAADAVPLPRWGRQISSGFAAKQKRRCLKVTEMLPSDIATIYTLRRFYMVMRRPR